jgi:lipopolysaccharide transport system permease protein
LGELWRFRELLVLWTWRDISVRYKQTVLGIAWVLVQPIVSMLVFAFVFGRVAKLDSGGVPYPIMTLAGLVIWQFSSGGLTRTSQSLVSVSGIIQKVYVPRLVFPISSSFAGIVDFLVACVLLVIMMGYYHVGLRWELLFLPGFLLMGWLTALGAGLWLGTLNVKYRDVGHALPFMMQILTYISPVAYSTSVIPEQWRFLYSLNPMVGVIDGFRWCVLGSQFAPCWPAFGVSLVLAILIFISGLFYFRYYEKTFADFI